MIREILGFFGTDTNLSEMAMRVTNREGGKESLSIAQVREVQRLVLEELGKLHIFAVARLLNRIGE